MATYEEAIVRAREVLGAGDLHQAEAIYRRIVAAMPQAAEAWHELGLVHLQTGRDQGAVEYLQQAVSLAPSDAGYAVNLAAAYRRLGQTQEALMMVERALTLRPDYATGHFNRGNLFFDLDRFAEAAESYRHVVELLPHDAVAHCKLGLAHLELGRNYIVRAASSNALDRSGLALRRGQLEQATKCFRRASQLQPDYAEAFGNLAIALTDEANLAEDDGEDASARLHEAADCWSRSLELQPGRAQSQGSVAVVLERLGDDAAAIAGWRSAIELDPAFAEAHHNLGVLFSKQGRLDDAAACWQRALELNPEFADALGNLGVLYSQQGRIAEARQCFERGLHLQPDQAAWRLNLFSLCPPVFESREGIAEYRRKLLDDLTALGDSKLNLDLAQLAAGACTPSFNLQFHGIDERPTREAYARIYSRCFPRGTTCRAAGRPRIGFVVTDQHETLFIRSLGGVLERLDANRFEIIIIGSARGLNTLRAGIANDAIRYLGVQHRLDRYVAAIRSAQVDLLYYWEVGTDSVNYFLPFYRLAPVQCTSWGIQVTSGVPGLDYYLSSSLVESDDAPSHYTERLVLADTLLTFQRRVRVDGPMKTRESFGIGPDRHLYLCAQQLGKFHPDFDPIVAGILRRDVQGIVLATHDRRSAVVADELRRRLTAHMPDVADRVVFLPFQPPREYLSLIAAADVLLDPLHFGGVNSTYDGFSLNQPIVTLPSAYQRGRYTLACYKKMGLDECVAVDAGHYIDIAVRLACDADHRKEVVERIRGASDVLFEDLRAVREHDRIFSELIERGRSVAQSSV